MAAVRALLGFLRVSDNLVQKRVGYGVEPLFQFCISGPVFLDLFFGK